MSYRYVHTYVRTRYNTDTAHIRRSSPSRENGECVCGELVFSIEETEEEPGLKCLAVLLICESHRRGDYKTKNQTDALCCCRGINLKFL
jgi:hypothetical protein